MNHAFLALINKTDVIDFATLCKIAADIQVQLSRHFYPIWRISASITVFTAEEDIPENFWKVVIDNKAQISEHRQDSQGLPYAIIIGANAEEIAFNCSHECLEMLVNPYGRKFYTGFPPQGFPQKQVKFYAEICDPCNNLDFGVKMRYFKVSDFVKRTYYTDPLERTGAYSCYGQIQHPFEVLEEGYIQWTDKKHEKLFTAVMRGGVMRIEEGQTFASAIDTTDTSAPS